MNFGPVVGSLVTLVSDPALWALILAGIPLGMMYGAVPGLGGRLGIVLSIPFVFGMEPTAGAVFLVAMHAVVHTGGSIPSILLGIPGTGPDAATVCDGHPMARKGEAGRALGASLGASAVGGVFGALFLAVLIPVVRPTVLAFGPAEFFFLALLGVTFIAAVSGHNPVEGVLVGALGLMLSFVGTELQTGVHRFTLGQAFLWDGIPVITSVLGMFTIPEVIALASNRGAQPPVPLSAARYSAAQLLQGVGDVGRHWALAVRTSLIGAVMGLLPGLGGDVASWTSYGHAVQSSKHPERFGSGAVEGVIGPEAANNSKEGGALLPTLFFGIPGSSGMAVMLGAFVMLGIQPGPEMALEHIDLVWILIWTLVIANILAALMFLAIGRWLALVPFLEVGLLVPFVLLLTLVGGYLGGGYWQSLILLIGIGLLGYGFKRCEWPRAPFVIGLTLGPLMDISLHQSLAIWGGRFVFRPIAMGLAIATIVTLVTSLRRVRSDRTPNQAGAGLNLAVSFVVFAIFTAMVAAALGYTYEARLVPLVIGVPAMLLAARQFVREMRARRWRSHGPSSEVEAPVPAVPSRGWSTEMITVLWLLLFTAMVLVAGMLAGGTMAVMASQRIWLGERWRTTAWGGAVAFLILHVCFERGFGFELYEGLAIEWIGR